MTTKQAAKELGCSHRQVQRYIKAGTLNAARVGKRVFVVTVDDLKKFRESREKVAPGSLIGAPQTSGDAVAPPLKVLPQYFHMTDQRSYAPLQPRSSAGELRPAVAGGPITNVPHEVSGNWPAPATMKARGERAAEQDKQDYMNGR